MKPIVSRVLIALGALLVLGAVNFAIAGKERVQRHGEIVYLPLEPVDPRSLLQGDYMALRFALVREIESREGDAQANGDAKADHVAREGQVMLAPVTLDDQHIATLAPAGATSAAAPLKLRYRIRGGHVWLGTNAFFFEEGSAERFSGARYGEFRVDRDSGEAVLVGLRNDKLEAM
jgi:uncharacterized membrane-anchored protein